MDDKNYPASWQGEHFPGLASGKLHLGAANGGNGTNGTTVHGNGAAHPGHVPVYEHRNVANVWAP
jgi:hypothetical protein